MNPLDFNNYYIDIIESLKDNNHNKILVLDGAQIYYFVDVNNIKEKIIIKKTSIIRSYLRAIKRDLASNKKQSFKILKRRISQVKDYKN